MPGLMRKNTGNKNLASTESLVEDTLKGGNLLRRIASFKYDDDNEEEERNRSTSTNEVFKTKYV